MNVLETLEMHENLAAQPEKLQELLETPRLCMLLNYRRRCRDKALSHHI